MQKGAFLYFELSCVTNELVFCIKLLISALLFRAIFTYKKKLNFSRNKSPARQ